MNDTEFEVFFRRVRPRLLRFAMRRVSDVDMANDIAIDALMVIWRRELEAPTTAAKVAQLEHLAFSIANGLVRNALRSTGRRARLMEAVSADAATHSAVSADPADILISPRDGRLERLPEVLARLPPAEREALVYFIDGYRIAEIAAILEKKPSAISARLQRAKSRLQVLLTEVKDRGRSTT